MKIELEVYDELIEVYANKSDVNRYNDAAKLVTDRYNTYAELFREKKISSYYCPDNNVRYSGKIYTLQHL